MKEKFCFHRLDATRRRDYERWNKVIDGTFYTDRPGAILPIIMCSDHPPTNDTMNEQEKELVILHLVVVNADRYENDHSECYNRPLRFIRSMALAHEPLSLEQLESEL